jgi:CDP-glycerol glycerophosphotransferase (TagB/SpsB family)
MPIDEHLIIFASEDDYTDNSYALYLYIKEHYSNYRLVWATINENPEYHPEIQHVHHPYRYTYKSAWYLSRAKFLFTTHGLGLQFYPREEQKALNIWHGIPIKAPKDSFKASDASRTQRDLNFSKVVYLGELNRASVASFVRCRECDCELLGYPRNDVLINNNSAGYTNPFVPSSFQGKVLIWMPTYRKSRNGFLSELQCDTLTGLPLLQNENDVKQFDKFLGENNLYIIAKIHHLQAENAFFKLRFQNIRFVVDTDIFDLNLQVYDVIGKSDALITDYSSVYIDYLLIDKPIGFILDDISEYEQGRGFLYDDIRPLLPGHYIYTVDDFKNYCLDVANGIDNYKADRKRVRDLMVKYQDNRSSERICAWAGIK